MPKLSVTSEQRLRTCHEDLQNLVNKINETFPVRVLCGYRNEADQDAAIAAKTSKTPWPKSKHNRSPSLAVDLLPEKLVNGNNIDWGNKGAFAEMADIAFHCADKLGIWIRHGGDFHQDGSKTENDAWDLPHIELMVRT